MKKIILLAVVLSAAWFLMPNKAHAASLTLSGSCSIDDAITNANNDDQSGSVNCTAGSGDDTINIPSGTWNFGTNNAITSNISFVGVGTGDSILDGSGTYGGLACDGTSGSKYTMSVSQLTITDTIDPGSSGQVAIAAKRCDVTIDTVELRDVTSETTTLFATTNNDDMTIDIDDLHIHDSVGVGLYFFEAESSVSTLTATVDRYTASNMTAGQAGLAGGIGVASRSGDIDVTVRNSTLLPSVTAGVGVYIFSRADDTVDTTATINLVNTTIAGNGTGALPTSGIYATSGADAGLSATTTINFQNVLIAGNDTGSGVVNCAGQNLGNGGTETTGFVSQGNNLSDDSSCYLLDGSDQENVNNLLTTLGPLQNNGGSTPTRALLAGSPAINAGATIAGITTDQRGVARPQGSAYDVGAYEYDGVEQDSGNSDNGSGSGSGNGAQGGGTAQNADQLSDTGDKRQVVNQWALVGLIVSTFGLVMSIRRRPLRYILKNR